MRIPICRSTLAAIAAAALSTAPAHAQALPDRGPFVGIGVGVSTVNDPDAGLNRVSPTLHGRVGWGFSPTLAAMVELTAHGLGDDRPQTSDLSLGSGGAVTWNRQPSVLNTVSLLASLQIGDPEQIYVRPGIGLGRHAIASYYTNGNTVVRAGESHEAGPAAGLAVGRTFRAAARVPVAVEALVLWSHGEDSAGSRWAAGFQVVPQIHF
jgi:hypothetical protein